MTLTEQIASVRREIAMRTRVYPNWVASKKMTQAKADHELAAMRAVLDTLQRTESLGATGRHPMGHVSDDDEGELRMAVGYDHIDGIVRIEFGKPVAWLGLPCENAIDLANTILRCARR